MKKTVKPGTLLAPLPVIMASLGRGEEQNIITIAWTGVVNSEPPMTYISVRKSRHSHPILMKEKEFVINLVPEYLAEKADWCGMKSGKDFNKFEEAKLTPVKATVVSCPMIKESPINLECKVTEVIELPSHDMFMAEIVAVNVNEELFDENGKIDYAKAQLVNYIHGEYRGTHKNAFGRFGYSIMKPKTKKRINREEHEKRVQSNKKKREERENSVGKAKASKKPAYSKPYAKKNTRATKSEK